MSRILVVRRAFGFEWDQYWSQDPTATFFHSREWAEIWRLYRKYRPVPQVVHFSDGRTVFLPLSRYGDALLSSPAFTYGGWLGNGKISAVHVSGLVILLFNHPGNLFWRVNPFDPMAQVIESSHVTSDHTHVLDLALGVEKVLSGWTESYRRGARRAERDGIVVRIATSEDDWRSYFEIYRDSLHRWGERTTEVYDWKLFRLMSASRTGNIRLWLACHEGRAVSGAVCMYGPQHIGYWHGATLASYLPRHPVQMLFREIIRDGCIRGFRWLDLGPSGGLAGVDEFKCRLGGVRWSSPCFTVKVEHDANLESQFQRRRLWGFRTLI